MLVEIMRIEDANIPRHSFIVEETGVEQPPVHSIPSAVRTETPMTAAESISASDFSISYTSSVPRSIEEKFGERSQAETSSFDGVSVENSATTIQVDPDGRVRIRSPPPHTPQVSNHFDVYFQCRLSAHNCQNFH